MMKIKRPIAALALFALAACSNAGTGVPVTSSSPKPIVTPASGVAFVGIGDSLTAGYQSDGFLGATTATSPVSSYPAPPFPLANFVPPGQENGWWALMYQSITGASTASLYNPSTSPLPLIAAPGMGTQIVLNLTTLFANVQTSCSEFNDAGFSSTAWATTRMDPSAQTYDLGVPGITMHEALNMTGPLTPPATGSTCGYTTLPHDPTSGGLQSLVNGESSVFYPVMAGYAHNVSSLTELNVALALKPKLTTVWLGANDLLKFSFSGGNPVASDSPTQMATDLTTIVKSLTAAGSKVLVADLPNVLSAPQFFPQGNRLVADLAQMLYVTSKGAISPSTAAALATQISTYIGTQYGVTAGGYLTETGFLDVISNCAANPAQCTTPVLDPSGAGSGLGGVYLTPALATEVQTLNTAYNKAIDTIATGSGSNVALVPITATFASLAPNPAVPGSAPNLNTVFSGAPSAYFEFGGGLVSWDGLHPSNLGYAVIANLFIGTADSAFGMTLPALSSAQLATIAATDPYSSALVDAGLGGPAFPLP
jgi:lysophospholipase L1-like esterase